MSPIDWEFLRHPDAAGGGCGVRVNYWKLATGLTGRALPAKGIIHEADGQVALTLSSQHAEEELRARMTDRSCTPASKLDGPSTRLEEPTLLLFSVSHRSAPVEIREKLAFDAVQRSALLADLREFSSEGAGITTCNRTDIYLVIPLPDDALLNHLFQTIGRHAGVDPDELAPVARIETDQNAVRYLFRVASGLESVVLGESQILGQAREALVEARANGMTGPVLERLFQRALATGKRSRAHTGISRGAGSISHAAVKLVRNTIGDLAGKRAVTIGAGEMGCLVARNLLAHGARDVGICNRTVSRATSVAREIGARVIPWDQLALAIHEADIVITATASNGYVLTREHLAPTNGHDGNVLIIDISVPRNVEPEVETLPHVQLFDIDALQAVRTQDMHDREREVPKVEAIIAEETDAFVSWYRGRQLAPVIQELYQQAWSIQQYELDRALRRLRHLSDRDQEVICALAHGITHKMLHTPVTRLKATETPDSLAPVLKELFDIN